MRLLLDEMWPPEIAVQFRRRGYDVVVVAERQELRGQTDPVIFAESQLEGRAIVTENVADYRPLAAYELQIGRSHAGLMLTTNRGFPRRDARTPGRLVAALDGLLKSAAQGTDLEFWLG